MMQSWLISVVLNVLQVFTRYALNDPLFWTEEMIRYTTVWLTFVGAAAASLYGWWKLRRARRAAA